MYAKHKDEIRASLKKVPNEEDLDKMLYLANSDEDIDLIVKTMRK